MKFSISFHDGYSKRSKTKIRTKHMSCTWESVTTRNHRYSLTTLQLVLKQKSLLPRRTSYSNCWRQKNMQEPPNVRLPLP